MVGSGRSQDIRDQHEKREGKRVEVTVKENKTLILKINLVNKRFMMQKNNICLFLCDGRLKALCHMTYLLYRAHSNTLIHLFRHLTCLERAMDVIIEESR